VIATDTEGRTKMYRVRLDGRPQRMLEMRMAE
jgi:hypothetical protein